jgi:hypothetical protein
MQAIKLSKGDSLYHRKTLFRSAFEVISCLVAVETMKQFPAGISQPEKWFAVTHNKMFVFAYSELRKCIQNKKKARG